MCDLVIVVTVTNREAKTAAHGISLFLVEDGMKGFQKGRKLDKIGLKAQVFTPFIGNTALKETPILPPGVTGGQILYIYTMARVNTRF